MAGEFLAPCPLGKTLQARGDIDAVAVDLLAIHHYVAEVHADAELHPAIGCGRFAFSALSVVWISTAHWTD